MDTQHSGLRVLIVSASLGAGHDGAANELARRLRDRGHHADVEDYLSALHGFARLLVQDGYEAQIKLVPASYDWLYKILETQPWALAIGRKIIARARRDVRTWLARNYDVIVSTYPLASQTLGRLRRAGELDVPVVTFLTDPSIHSYWVCEHVDLHAAVIPQTAADAGHLCPSVPAVAVGPLVHDRHRLRLTPAERRAVRRDLGAPPDAPLALLVAGSWGVGDVERTVRTVLAGGVAVPVVACGKNEQLRGRLAEIPGVVPLGWRTDMHRVMAAVDVLLQNAGGLSCQEALVSGLPVVSHACIPGHGYTNAQALADAGLAPWSRDDDSLAGVLREALTPAARATARRRAADQMTGEFADVVEALALTGDVRKALEITPGSWAPPRVRPDAVAQARAEHRLRVTVGPRVPAPELPVPLPLPVQTAPAEPAEPLATVHRLDLAAPRSGRHSRLLRRAAGLAGATAAVSVLGTTGVAAATSHGYGWSQHDTAAIVVRVDSAQLGPQTVAELQAVDAAVAVSRQLAAVHPEVVRRLSAARIDLLNGGWGPGRHGFTETQQDLLGARRAIGTVAGVTPTAWIPDRHIDAVDITVAFTERERVVVPVAREAATGPFDITHRAGVVVLDTRGLSDSAAADRVAGLAAALRAAGLTVTGVPDSWLPKA